MIPNSAKIKIMATICFTKGKIKSVPMEEKGRDDGSCLKSLSLNGPHIYGGGVGEGSFTPINQFYNRRKYVKFMYTLEDITFESQ